MGFFSLFSRNSLLCLFFLLFLFGCLKQQSVPSFKNIDKVSALDLMQRVQAERKKIQSVEGRAKLRIYRNGKRRKTIRLLFKVQRPMSIHFQMIAAFGQPALVITSNGDEFGIHNLIEKHFVRGPSSRLVDYLHDFLPLDIPLRELVPILLGELPLFVNKSQLLEAKKDAFEGYFYRFQAKDVEQKLWINGKELHFIKTAIRKPKKKPFLLEYGMFRGHPLLPKKIRFVLPSKGMSVSWIFTKQSMVPALPSSDFSQTIPSDSKLHILNP